MRPFLAFSLAVLGFPCPFDTLLAETNNLLFSVLACLHDMAFSFMPRSFLWLIALHVLLG